MDDFEIDVNAKTLLESLTTNLDFSVPKVDFNDPAFQIPEDLADALQKVPDALTLDLLTECKLDGAGAFDKIMTSLKLHLQQEYEEQRITGAEYAKVYVAMMQYALQYAVQFLLGKDNAYYTALNTQAQALTANLDAYTAKVRLAIAQSQAHLSKAQYANEVLKLSTVDKQTDLIMAQTETQKKQKELLIEQTEQAHAQVSDTRIDGTTPVTGYTGNQNKLLQQQVQAFKNDTVIKGTKIFTDSFATQLSMGEATVAGTGLDAAGILSAVEKLQSTINSSAS